MTDFKHQGSSDEWNTPRGTGAIGSQVSVGLTSSDAEYDTPRGQLDGFDQFVSSERLQKGVPTRSGGTASYLASRTESKRGGSFSSNRSGSQYYDSDSKTAMYETAYDAKRSSRHETAYKKEEETVAVNIGQGMTADDVEDIFSYARHGRADDVERLFERGMPLRSGFGQLQILTIACQNGNKRIAKIALRRGADINARNFKGNTPLHYCFTYGYSDTLGSYLIEKGADPQLRNNEGRLCSEGI